MEELKIEEAKISKMIIEGGNITLNINLKDEVVEKLTVAILEERELNKEHLAKQNEILKELKEINERGKL